MLMIRTQLQSEVLNLYKILFKIFNILFICLPFKKMTKRLLVSRKEKHWVLTQANTKHNLISNYNVSITPVCLGS